jgi:hypothetical protein
MLSRVSANLKALSLFDAVVPSKPIRLASLAEGQVRGVEGFRGTMPASARGSLDSARNDDGGVAEDLPVCIVFHGQG